MRGYRRAAPATTMLSMLVTDPPTFRDVDLDRPAGSHTPVLRVIVADDHPLFRHAICTAIARHPGLALVGEAIDGVEALTLIDTLEPDVAVLDHRMPGLSGQQVCALLQARPTPPPTALLVVSAFEDAELVTRSVASGAVGYIGKAAPQREICAAIEEVGRGGIAFTETTARALTS